MTVESWKLGAVPRQAEVLVDTPYAVCGKTTEQGCGDLTTTTYFGTRPGAHALLCRDTGLHDPVILLRQSGRYDHAGGTVIKTVGGYRRSVADGILESEFECVQHHALNKLGINIPNIGSHALRNLPRHEFLPIGVVRVPVTGFIITNWKIVGEPSEGFERLEVTLDEAAKMAQNGTIYDECSRSLIMWAWRRAKEAETRELHELVVESALVGGLPDLTYHSDAIIVFPGRGETERVKQATFRFLEHADTLQYLLVAGDNPDHLGAEIYSSAEDIVHNAPHLRNRIHCQGIAHNTLKQARWAVKMLGELEVKVQHAVLAVSPYHLLRAYCTLIREINRSPNPARVWPMQMDISPESRIPHPNDTDTAWEAGLDEIPRLLAYRRKGDIASHAELMEYVNRLNK